MHSIATLLNSFLAAGTLPASEVRLLMMHALQKTRIQLITQADSLLADAQVRTIQQLIERRVQGEPIAYLIGEREFFSLSLQITPDVLIPRPDTELLVELSLRLAPQQSTLLDLGTGSGAIAIAIAHQRPDLQMWASDVSSSALIIARSNVAMHRCQITLVESDWYVNLPDMQWQTIVSNPPYIAQFDPHLVQGDLRFEPMTALTDHADGLSAYGHIISGATGRLCSGGWLLLEHGYDQAHAVRTLLVEHGFSDVQSWRDLAGIERVSGAKWVG